jgi:5-dehydro-2-deoxygluconokinase
MTPRAAAGPEVITIGRISVDLYPQQIGVSLAEVRTFAKAVGGSPTNVAVAASRLGRRAAVITKVGDDPFGRYLTGVLPQRFGVDARWVGTHPSLRTPLAFCEIYPPDHFPLLFYREPKAPDLELTATELDLGAIGRAPLFWFTGTGLSAEPSREATLAALAARPRDLITVYDLDHRPMFWKNPADATRYARQALASATVAVGNQEEAEVATGTRDPLDASKALLDLGVRIAIVKQGPRGVLARTAGEIVEVPPTPVEVVNGLGAGDAFGGSLAHGLLAGWDLERILRQANAAGAIVAARLLCSDAMPTQAEVDAMLATGVVPEQASADAVLPEVADAR